MAYAAAPAAAPATPAAPATESIEEGRAPPTIDSHGGKLTPMSVCYADSGTSFLLLAALLSPLFPRRLPFRPAVDIGWTRLLPGLFVCSIVIWNGLSRPIYASSSAMDIFLRIQAILLGLVFVGAVLGLLSDFLLAPEARGRRRGIVGMAAGLLSLLPLLSLDVFDWITSAPQFDPNPVKLGMWTCGLPLGVGMVFLWRRFNGVVFDLIAFFGGIAALILVSSVSSPLSGGMLGMVFVTFTVAATIGSGLKVMGSPAWQGLTGRAIWALLWMMRAALVAVYASC